MIKPIQSLRGLAVLLVVLGHWGVFFESGFIGVDAFFVISGYVVTLVALRRLKSGEFGVSRFLLARFRRLFPALGATVLAVVVFQLFYYPSFEWYRATEEGLWSVLWISNIFAQIRIGDYFGETAGTSLLLHTWSLSVEFQSYIVLAILLFWLLVRVQKLNAFRLMILLLSIISISISLFASIEPSSGIFAALTSYYSPLTRFYQIGAGVLLATYNSRKPETHLPISAIGVVLIVGTAAVPSGLITWNWSGLITVVGALMFIHGIKSKSGSESSFDLMARVGNMSYSIYLWHWPILVIVKSTVPNLYAQFFVGFVVTGLLSFASHRFLEAPFMSGYEASTKIVQRKVALPASAAIISISLFLGTVSFSTFTPEPYAKSKGVLIGDVTQSGFADSFDALLSPCPGADENISPNVGVIFDCYETTDEEEIDILVLGNSHAAHLIPGIVIKNPNIKLRYLSFSGGFTSGNPDLLRTLNYWDSSGGHARQVHINSFWQIEKTDFRELGETLARLEIRQRDTFIYDDVPNFKISALRCKYSELFVVPALCEEHLPNFQAHLEEFWVSIGEHLPEANLVKSSKFFLVDNSYFRMAMDGKILFRDQNHLNVIGSLELSEYLSKNGYCITKGVDNSWAC